MPPEAAPGDEAGPVQVRLIGAVGGDGGGDPLLRNLKENGVDVSGVQEARGQNTGLCIAIIDTETRDNRLFITPGANLRLRPEAFKTLDSLAGGAPPDLIICNLVIARDTPPSRCSRRRTLTASARC